ncbi:MAG: SDR family oxidoreductase [Nitrosomonas sp.]|uniref:SDR family oxidoreductase n=1 Tax=Nitrosomonas sp. TaxID=42353 RepID=UPI0025D4068F|nr:SDR family oxidoreductase [Nitrosomonas sp.]MCG7757636.1 SDR family oxidoreductase [Nitrosomonas sp.]UJP01038.1 MAG: SDR family oxidoreductase [Nitrosomonas sp.]UJP03879.1 MAG: SDR family oxidoreductase [Nitrosomonas sp.]UJP07574.1 MAG: SDR family oxidoreductase [Nitrosomonas sp.]
MKKTILITGCSSGIGYCAAKGLQERGYRVFATARKRASVEKLLAEGLESFRLDLNDSNSIHFAFEETMRRTGGELYALFNNGAYGLPGAVEDLNRDALRAQFETNVFGWQELTNLVIPVMRRQGYGRIIQNSSVLGFVALPFRGAYNASKYAIEGLSDTLRLELKGSNVFVSLIEPGPIASQFRTNAVQALQKYIDIENSFHREKYQGVLSRLNKPGPAVPFTLPPEAVLKRVIHALEAEKPQARYYVTVPTYLFGILKRILSTRALDVLLAKSGNNN